MMSVTTTLAESEPSSVSHPGSRRILMVTHGYPPNQTGGAELQAQRKVSWWSQRGHTVRVLAADAHSGSSCGAVERVETPDGSVSICRVRFRAPDGTRPFAETFHHPLLAAEIDRELRAFAPDLVYQVSGYLFGLLPLERAAALGIPSALFAMDFWHICPRLTLLRPNGVRCPGPRHPADCAACRTIDRPFVQRSAPVAGASWHLLAGAGRLPIIGRGLGTPVFANRESAVASALAGVSLVVANSRFLAGQLRALGVRDERLLIVRQGLDWSASVPPRPERQAGEPLRVLYLGQIAWHKGVDLVAEAVGELAGCGRAIQLRIHGQSTGGEGYVERIRRYGNGHAIQVGAPLGRGDLMEALVASDVLVVPSRWYENSPNVILEAFAAGTPVVVAGHGGMAELVRDGVDGLHIVPGDRDSLTRALARLVDEPGLLSRLRRGVIPPGSVDDEMRAEDEALARLLEVGV